MSRRREFARTEIEFDQELADAAQAAAEPWWFDEPMPYPWDPYSWREWAEAWGAVTLRVVDKVWREVGARYYFTPENWWLRDDLRSWMNLEAGKTALAFTPDPWHPTPQAQWGAFLRGRLRTLGRQHFMDILGDPSHSSTAAGRIEAHNAGIDSTDRLDAAQAETGAFVSRRGIGDGRLETADPYVVVTRIDSLRHRAEELESRRVASARDGLCAWGWCENKARARGLCHRHYEAERRGQEGRGEWQRQTGPTNIGVICAVEGCGKPAKTRQMCSTHYNAALLADAPACAEGGCEKPAHSHGLCRPHRRRQQRQEAA